MNFHTSPWMKPWKFYPKEIYFPLFLYTVHVKSECAHLDQLLITLASLIRHTRHVGIPLLAVAAHHTAVIELVLTQELLQTLRDVVGVNVDLDKGIMGGWLLHSLLDAGLQPRQEQIQPVMDSK